MKMNEIDINSIFTDINENIRQMREETAASINLLRNENSYEHRLIVKNIEAIGRKSVKNETNISSIKEELSSDNEDKNIRFTAAVALISSVIGAIIASTGFSFIN